MSHMSIVLISHLLNVTPVSSHQSSHEQRGQARLEVLLLDQKKSL